MTPSLKKRFWKTVTVTQDDTGFGVALDQHQLKTPLKASFCVPTRALADLARDEWDAQIETVAPMAMPTTRLINATLDKVSINKQAVIDNLAEYAGTDLLCYRAERPAELVGRQADAWDPILGWAASEFKAPLKVTAGVMFVEQPEQSLANLKAELEKLSAFELSAAHELISISGSLVVAMSVLTNHLSVEQAWEACRVDETFQIEQWGADEEAEEMAALKAEAFAFAKTFYDACQ